MDQLEQKLFYLYDKFKKCLKPTFIRPMNKKLGNGPHEGSSTKQLYLKSVQLYRYDPRDKQIQLAENAALWKNRLMSCIWNHFQQNEKQSTSIRGRNNGVSVRTDKPT